MFVQPIDYALVVWLALAAASTAYVAYDQFAGNPEATVLKWGFVLITVYMGPFGLLMYVMADKEPGPRRAACTPPLLPVVGAAAATGDPLRGAVLMLAFGVVRGVPIVVAGSAIGAIIERKQSRVVVLWAERARGALVLGAALYFLYRGAVFADWLAPSAPSGSA